MSLLRRVMKGDTLSLDYSSCDAGLRSSPSHQILIATPSPNLTPEPFVGRGAMAGPSVNNWDN